MERPHSGGDSSYNLLRRFIEVCSYFPPTITHANTSGPLAGPRALQMSIRKSSVWTPIGFNPNAPSLHLSMSHEMERIASDRQRRKDYIQWARIHAAALELGMLGVNGDSNGQFVSGRSFSEVMARDSVWQEDEVEWCAGICVLRAIIRTGLRGGPGQRREYEELLRTYEGRWKEIKDEARQALVTVSPLSLKSSMLINPRRPRRCFWVLKMTLLTLTIHLSCHDFLFYSGITVSFNLLCVVYYFALFICFAFYLLVKAKTKAVIILHVSNTENNLTLQGKTRKANGTHGF